MLGVGVAEVVGIADVEVGWEEAARGPALRASRQER